MILHDAPDKTDMNNSLYGGQGTINVPIMVARWKANSFCK
jgi:hypothetical protein